MEAHVFLALICAWICLSVPLEFCTAADSMMMNQSISDGETLVSTGQRFELGFFSPGSSNKRYLGIWYKNIPDTVVWVANRNNPITDSYGVLTIINNGGLVLLNRTKSSIWSSNLSRVPENPVAELLDNGNLVLWDNSSDESSKSYVWQSFDHPSDTMLPGMKIGWDLKTGLQRNLTSWRSADDPSLGEFSYAIDINILPYTAVRDGSSIKVRSGPWDGIEINGVNLFGNSVFKSVVVNNKDEVYVLYESQSDDVITRLLLNSSGSPQLLLFRNGSSEWEELYSIPDDICDNYGHCGANGICRTGKLPICECLTGFTPKSQEEWDIFNTSGGCTRTTPLDCPSEGGFLKVTGVKLPDLIDFHVTLDVSLTECKGLCSNNCSCSAYAYSNLNGSNGCLMWSGGLIDIRELTSEAYPEDIYIRVHTSELESNTKQKKKLVIILVVSTFFGVLIICLAIWFLLRKKGRTGTDQGSDENLELPLFDMGTVATATNNFSDTNRIGAGGFGSVYKGNLPAGVAVAVKRLSKNSAQGVQEFKNEAVLIAKLQHKNLVRLLGCCVQGEERLLVYEYMPNKSLDYFIFDQNRRTLLAWGKRHEIVMGIARGLLYLHQDSRFQIVHRDLKASNILLDDNLNPKISDFGLARIFGENETQTQTKRIVGTYGYMSPEYVIDGHYSVKSDVFSFGVLLLEIVSGKKNRGFYHPDHHHNLLGHAWLLWDQNMALELMDACLDDSCVASQVLRCIQVGLLCVQSLPADRPAMSSVIFMLGNEGAPLPQPKHPGFFAERSSVDTDTTSGNAESLSENANAVSISMLEGR